MQHRVIGGRIYRVVQLEAADTRAAGQHISAEKPVSYATQKRVREEVDAE